MKYFLHFNISFFMYRFKTSFTTLQQICYFYKVTNNPFESNLNIFAHYDITFVILKDYDFMVWFFFGQRLFQ